MLSEAVPETTRFPMTIALFVGVEMKALGGFVSWNVVVPVLNFNSYGANIELPETMSTPFVTRTVIVVEAGRPPLAVKVIASRAADHTNVPASEGVVRNADCTLFVSIGLLN